MPHCYEHPDLAREVDMILHGELFGLGVMNQERQREIADSFRSEIEEADDIPAIQKKRNRKRAAAFLQLRRLANATRRLIYRGESWKKIVQEVSDNLVSYGWNEQEASELVRSTIQSTRFPHIEGHVLEEADHRFHEGRRLLEACEYEEAIGRLTEAIELNPDKYYYRSRAHAYSGLGRYEEAWADRKANKVANIIEYNRRIDFKSRPKARRSMIARVRRGVRRLVKGRQR